MEKILDRDFTYPQRPNIDDTVKNLIDRLTAMNPHDRLGLKDMQAIKDHPYFDGFDFSAVKNQMMTRPPLPNENGGSSSGTSSAM